MKKYQKLVENEGDASLLLLLADYASAPNIKVRIERFQHIRDWFNEIVDKRVAQAIQERDKGIEAALGCSIGDAVNILHSKSRGTIKHRNDTEAAKVLNNIHRKPNVIRKGI